MSKPFFNRVAILGLGLMGGSLALAIRQKGLAGTLIGQGRREDALKQSVKRDLIDDYELDAAVAVRDADLVILASPINTLKKQLAEIAPHLKKGALVMDVGSTKSEIEKAALKHLPKTAFFVGAHPLAGTEKRGVESALSDLYAGKTCVLTFSKSLPRAVIESAKLFWDALGMRIVVLPAADHDRILAATSHLPQMVAYALMNAVALLAKPEPRKNLSGSGLRDTTRIAASPSDVWLDICDSNQKEILAGLKVFSEQIKILEKSFKNKASLKKFFDRAAAERKRL